MYSIRNAKVSEVTTDYGDASMALTRVIKENEGERSVFAIQPCRWVVGEDGPISTAWVVTRTDVDRDGNIGASRLCDIEPAKVMLASTRDYNVAMRAATKLNLALRSNAGLNVTSVHVPEARTCSLRGFIVEWGVKIRHITNRKSCRARPACCRIMNEGSWVEFEKEVK